MIHLQNNTIGDILFIKGNASFSIGIDPIHPTDTVLVKIDALKTDTLLFKTVIKNACCASPSLNSILFNGFEVYDQTQDPNKVIVLKKAIN